METLIEKLNQIDGVNATSWEKHGKTRVYINLTKSQNRFAAYSGKLFVENGELIIQAEYGGREDDIRKSECSGAATYRKNLEILKQIREVL